MERFLVRLMACNADDGTACGMAGMPEMRQAFLAAHQAFRRLHPSGPDSEFLKLLREECLGIADLPLAPKRPTTPRPFAKLVKTPLDVSTVSTVVTVSTLVRLISRADKATFKRKGVRFSTPSGAIGTFLSDHIADKLVQRIGRLPVSERNFAIADDESHGRPYLWFTPKTDLDAALSTRVTYSNTRADVARDLLGLIHHGPLNWETGGPNHLFALHIPADVIVAGSYMRPAAPQAFDNRRFILRFDDGDPQSADDWGRTLDREYFATRSTGRPIGGRVRVLLRLQASIMPAGTKIGFDYLGTVSATRGKVTSRDDDTAFLGLVRRGRNADNLVLRMCR